MTRTAAHLVDLTVDIATHNGRYAPVVRTLNKANLTVTAGKLTALIGESGCGKSLVAAALCGLLPPGSHVDGAIMIDDADFSNADERRWRAVRGHDVGSVPQSAATSFTPVRTVGSQLSEVCRRLKSNHTAAQLLSIAQLPVDTGSLYPHELSGGMAQRAAIAAAIAGRPRLLVADEPTSALDPEHAAGVWDLLGTVARGGAGVLAITHDLPSLLAAGVCHDIALMRGGTVVCQAPVAEMRSSADGYVRSFFAGVLS